MDQNNNYWRSPIALNKVRFLYWHNNIGSYIRNIDIDIDETEIEIEIYKASVQP